MQRVLELKMLIKGTNIVAENEELKINAEVYSDGKETDSGDFMLFALRSHGIKNSIEFRNVLGNRYRTKIKTSYDTIEVIEPPTRITLLNQISFWLRYSFYSETQLRLYRILWKFTKPYIKWSNKEKNKAI